VVGGAALSEPDRRTDLEGRRHADLIGVLGGLAEALAVGLDDHAVDVAAAVAGAAGPDEVVRGTAEGLDGDDLADPSRVELELGGLHDVAGCCSGLHGGGVCS